jgi:hypoxanthine phosphoribosyltransferase
VVHPASRLARGVAELGRAISRDFAGRTVDAVIFLKSSFIFAADLFWRISRPVVCHFGRAEIRDVKQSGFDRHEVPFSQAPQLEARDVLVVDTVLDAGVMQEFLLRRLLETGPRSLRLVVLVDKPRDRRVDLQPDYFGFVVASKYLAGSGMAGSRGRFRNLSNIATRHVKGRRSAVRAGKTRQVR